MKKIVFLLVLFTTVSHAQVVNIPDANFKARLLSANASNGIAGNSLGEYCTIDSNNNGEIEVTEALAIRSIFVKNPNNANPPITDLTGIESFTNLLLLDCSSNQLTTLDVSALINLQALYCHSNRLTSLNLGNLTSIKSLICFTNQLTELNVSNLSNIQDLACGSNLLTTLDLSGLTQLTSLSCHGNFFTTLEVGHLTMLESFSFGNSGLQVVDLHSLINLVILSHWGIGMPSQVVLDLPNLQYFSCYDDPAITTMDLSGCSSLLNVSVGRNSALTYLNTKNGGHLYHFIDECPNLLYICTNDIDLSHTTSSLIGNGNNPLAYTSSYCSFTPGGDYNTISGNILFDLANDGCDTSDFPHQYVKAKINDGTMTGSTFTSSSGAYTFYTQAGNFTITPEVENPSYFNFSPPTATLNFPLVDNSTQIQDFCVTANGIHPDLEVTFVPIGNARPGFNAHYKLVYKNKGNQTLSGNITLNYDSNKLDFISTFPDDNFELNANQILWYYSNLLPFETRSIDLLLEVNAPPTVNNGDILNFTATVNPTIADETPLDNTFEFNQTVVNSYDPNQIECLEGNTIAPEEVGRYLRYNIDFENVGTADAINVVVKSTIDTEKYNLNSLQLQYASHDVETKVIGNIVEFIFKNIHLQPSTGGPIGGHGNVLFKIKTLPDLIIGDEVMGSASIFFDYNAPIDTNEARTLIASLKNPGFVEDKTIKIAPNPVKDKLFISAQGIIKSVQLFDVQGRILQTVLEHKKATTLDITDQANGVYFIKVITETGGEVQKIMKEN